MSFVLCFIFLLTAICGCLDEESKDSEPSLKILIINSYHEGMKYVEDELNDGIIEGLKRSGYQENMDYTLNTFWMDTKVTYTTLEQIEQRAEIAIELINDFKPDIVFVNDDNALQYVAVTFTRNNPEENLPFIFAGINVNPTIYDSIDSLEEPGGAITGILERYPYKETFALGEIILPNASKILLLADASSSSDFVVQTFNEQFNPNTTETNLEVLGFLQVETFEEWKNMVNEYQTKTDILGVLNYHQLKDENGVVVPTSDVEEWMIENNDVPEIGTMASYAENGFLAVVSVSYYESGVYVGGIGGEILNGSNPGTIPIIDPHLIDTYFNLERAEMLGVTIPSIELSRATSVFYEIADLN